MIMEGLMTILKFGFVDILAEAPYILVVVAQSFPGMPKAIYWEFGVCQQVTVPSESLKKIVLGETCQRHLSSGYQN